MTCFQTAASNTSEETEVSSGSSASEDDNSYDIDSRLSSLKEGLVSAPVILSHVSGEQIFGSGDKEMVFLKGLADPGDTVEISVNGITGAG